MGHQNLLNRTQGEFSTIGEDALSVIPSGRLGLGLQGSTESPFYMSGCLSVFFGNRIGVMALHSLR